MIVTTAPLRSSPLWSVRSPYSQVVIDACKTIPGMWWSPVDSAWVGYKDAVARVRLALAKEPSITLDGDTPYALDWKDADPPYAISEKDLAEYQKEAVRFCLVNGQSGAILALAPGAGKSAVFLRTARALKERTVIVVPAPVRSSWTMPDKEMGQVKRWWPDAFKEMMACEGTMPGAHDWHFYKRKGYWQCRACYSSSPAKQHPEPLGCPAGIPTDDTQIVVIHYDIVHAWLNVLLAWGPYTLGIDEGHLLANPKSRRHQAVAALAAACRFKIILTGTPLTNRPKDMYGVVECISPGRFGAYVDRKSGELKRTFHGYGVKYCGGHQKQIPGRDMKVVWDFSGASNEKELVARMKHMMLYRTKEQLGIELPPIRTIVVELDVPSKYVVRPSLAFMRDKKAVRASLAAAADGKMGQAIQLSLDDASAGHKKVVFTFRRSIAEMMAVQLNAKGVKSDFIHGGILQSKRDEILTRARAHDGAFILCCTIDTCGTGIDLTFADIADFVELTYEPHEIIQARARLHRRRQKNHVLVRILIAKGTTDDLVKEMLLKKIRTFKAVVGETDDDIGSSLDNSPKGQAALDELYEMMKKRLEKEST